MEGPLATRPPEVPGLDVRHRWLHAGRLRMHVAEAGDPDGEPLLLLHGWPQNWYCWRDVMGPLAQRHRVICPDLRGFGWSDAPHGDYAKETLATDVLALMDALGLGRVRLIGHDWGGWVGFLLCLRAPERFERFVALNISHPWSRQDLRMLKALPRFWYQAVAATVGKRLVASPAVARRLVTGGMSRQLTPAEVDAYAIPLSQRPWVTQAVYRTFLTRELPAIVRGHYRHARLRVPTLILFGEDDAAIDTVLLRGGERNADDLRVELVRDCGHFIAEERPELVVARALRFFAGSAA